MNPVRIEPEATEELVAAAEGYERRRVGVGRELTAAVAAALATVGRDPQRFPPCWRDRLR